MQHFQNIETASGLRKFSLQSLFNPMNEYTFIETYLNYLNNRLLDTLIPSIYFKMIILFKWWQNLIKSTDKFSEVILSDRKWNDFRWHDYLKQPYDQFADKKAYRSSSPDVFWKNVFLEISHNSRENTCARESLWIKLKKIEKESLAQVFSCKFLQNIQEHLFYRTHPVTASERMKSRRCIGNPVICCLTFKML